MIVEEYLNNGTLVKHYSDKGVLIRQVETGAKYDEALDVVPCRYTYEETNEYNDFSEQDISADEFYSMLEEVL